MIQGTDMGTMYVFSFYVYVQYVDLAGFQWHVIDKEMIRLTIQGVIKVIVNPFVAILITGSRIFLGEDNKLEKKITDVYLFPNNMDEVKGLKMFEIIGILFRIFSLDYRPTIKFILNYLACIFRGIVASVREGLKKI